MLTLRPAWSICLLVFIHVWNSYASSPKGPISAELLKSKKTLEKKAVGEIVLHLNKSIFYQGESLWFTAYVTGDSELATIDLNFTLGIYDAQGRLLKNGFFYLEDGVAQGTLSLKYPPGEYVIKAGLQQEDEIIEGVKSTTIIRVQDQLGSGSENSASLWEVEWHPENKRLVTNVPNRLMFKYVSSGPFMQQIDELYLSDGEQRISNASVYHNALGYGSITWTPEFDREYQLVIKTYDRKSYEIGLPKVYKKGFSAQLNPLLNKSILVTLSDTRLREGEEETYTVQLGKKGAYLTTMVQLGQEPRSLRFTKSELPPGITTIWIFNQGDSLVYQRTFLTESARPVFDFRGLNIHSKLEKDSVILNLSGGGHFRSLSMTVLPKDSGAKSYNDWSEHLSPGRRLSVLVGQEQSKNTRKRLADANLVLMESTDSLNISDAAYPAIPLSSSGFKMKGQLRLTGIHEQRNIMLYQQSVGKLYTTSLSSNGQFEFKGLYLAREENIQFTARLDEKMVYNPEVKFQISPNLVEDSIEVEGFFVSREALNSENSTDSVDSTQVFLGENRTLLEEVVLTGESKENQLERREEFNPFFDGYKIGPELLKKYTMLSMFIRKLGYRVEYTASGRLVILSRRIKEGPPNIYVNGVRSSNVFDDIPMDVVNEIYHENVGLDWSPAGSIHIYRRAGKYEKRPVVFSEPASVGFLPASVYENPIVSGAFFKRFRESAAVHWEGEIEFNNLGEAQIEFPHFGLDAVWIRFAGWTKEGEWVSWDSEISLTPVQSAENSR
ncbi:hypothetical protein [Croceiramulus getboli]|nr:hypothetical protein P8624_07750 [Flavobacteriaceae bacterium YJPT1-3]